MNSLMKKTIPVALVAFLTACGGGGSSGGSDGKGGSNGPAPDPLAELSYAGQSGDATISASNKDAVADEVVDFARAFITVAQFQEMQKNFLNFRNEIAAIWFDDDLFEEDLVCSTGTYKSSITEKNDDAYELNFDVTMNKCALTIDSSIMTFTGTFNLYEYQDTNSQFNLYKDNYSYDMKISADGLELHKKGRLVDESYDDHKGNGDGDWSDSTITVVMDIYGKSLKFTMDADSNRFIKSSSGKIYKSENLLAYDYNHQSDPQDRGFSLEGDKGSPYVYLPTFGKAHISVGGSKKLKACDNDNFESGTINVIGQGENSVDLKITYSSCGVYTVSVVE